MCDEAYHGTELCFELIIVISSKLLKQNCLTLHCGEQRYEHTTMLVLHVHYLSSFLLFSFYGF